MFNSKQNVQSLFGFLACLVVTSVVSADGQVFVLDQRNFSGPHGFRDAQQACASLQARLAAVEELHHAVVDCFFSQCTRGWLYGGAVGTTVCNIQGSSLKTVNVRIENSTEDSAHVSAFCIKDKVVACGDPPSFPNARLQEHSGSEMGDELLYTCAPGYVMPSGLAAFSLLCDSCGEWYGSVQICIKDNTESHVDYLDKFEDSYEQADRDHDSSEKDHDDSYEEMIGGPSQDEKRNLQQQETGFRINVEENQDPHKERDIGGMVINNRRVFQGAVEEVAKNGEQVHPRWETERSEVVGTDASITTEEPVSLLSQKHLFWFPSEAFQEEGHPFSTDSVTQTTQRASGSQSQESKENESLERHHISHPVDVDDHDDEQDRFDDHDNSRHDDDEDDHEDDHTDDPDDADSHQEDDDVKRKGQPDDFDRRDRHKDRDNHDDHYDMGEHEEDRDRVHHDSREYDDRDDAYDDHHSHEDHDDATDDGRDKDVGDSDVSEEHPDHNDHDDDDDNDDRDLLNHNTHEDHNDKYDSHYDDHDSHEDDDGPMHVFFSVATEGRSNITQRGTGSKTTKDETWLDGYPVQEAENGDSTRKPIRPVDGESVVKTTDKPNEVELRRRVPHISFTDKQTPPSMAPESDQGVVEKVRPGFRNSGTSPDHLQHSDSPSYSDTLNYDTQQAAPTHSWLDELTEHPFLDHGPAPPMHDGDFFPGVMEEHTVHNLPGEMGEVEGEMGETICVGEDCPPHPPNSASRGPTVAAIIVVVCAVVMAVIFGVWCYRRQQQKSSVYEMNEKGQSQTRPGQQIEMQQKV